jgi:hypothetical protein
MAARVSTPGHSSHLTCVADDLDLLCGASISGGLQRVQALPQHLLLLSLTACAEDGGVPPTNSPLLLLGAGEDPRRPRAQWRVVGTRYGGDGREEEDGRGERRRGREACGGGDAGARGEEGEETGRGVGIGERLGAWRLVEG